MFSGDYIGVDSNQSIKVNPSEDGTKDFEAAKIYLTNPMDNRFFLDRFQHAEQKGELIKKKKKLLAPLLLLHNEECDEEGLLYRTQQHRFRAGQEYSSGSSAPLKNLRDTATANHPENNHFFLLPRVVVYQQTPATTTTPLP